MPFLLPKKKMPCNEISQTARLVICQQSAVGLDKFLPRQLAKGPWFAMGFFDSQVHQQDSGT